MYLSLYCKGSKRVTWGLRVRGSWRPNRNCNILTLTLMAVNVVSFSFSRCSSGGPLCWVMAFFTASYQHLLWTPTHQGLKPLRPGVAFLTTSRLQLRPNSNWNWNYLNSVLTVLYNSSTPTFWNRILDHHQAEITVMQFTGHFLLVPQSMSVPWEFFLPRPISSANFCPRDFLS